MHLSLDQLEAAALQLSVECRAQLAEKLLQSLESVPGSDNERIWLLEARRRYLDLHSGAVQTRDGSVVMRDAFARLP